MGLVNQACKRPMRPKTASNRKKPRIKDLLYAPKADSQRYQQRPLRMSLPSHIDGALRQLKNLQIIFFMKTALLPLRGVFFFAPHTLP